MKKIIFLLILITFLIGCVTKAKPTVDQSNEFEKLILNAQDMTNRGKYFEAINILNQGFEKFPNTEVLTLNYNIGFNYFKLNNYEEAKKYFNRVINLFENNQAATPSADQDQNEDRKYVVLSGVMLDRIQKEIEAKKDPYHIKEDIQDNKNIKPKKAN